MSNRKEDVKVVNNSSNLPEVDIIDNSTTKGKVSGKFTLVDDAQVTDAIEKIDRLRTRQS